MSVTSRLIRFAFRRSDDKRDAGLTTPEDIRRFDDIPYGPDRTWNVLDVYRPKTAEGALPVIVSVHGGGWVYGDKERYQYYCMSLAQRGFAVVNYTYRLAPKYKFPAPLEDTARVFGWLLQNASAYGFDTENVFAVGDSAGAQLLGLFSCLCTNEEYAKTVPVRAPEGSRPKAVALNCGVYRIEKSKKKDLTSLLMTDYLPGGGTEEELRQVSVIEHVSAAFPPAFVMTAEGDFLAAQAPPFVEKLRSLGVRAEYHYYGDSEHALGHVFHCNIRLPEAQRCNDEECAFFRRSMTKTERGAGT
ncbi:MAG: alpha/beta hydrolase [Oscillospiraceae bacterium]|nr:alpha/beta hydrolase [Oscillospiraceae bacterium]